MRIKNNTIEIKKISREFSYEDMDKKIHFRDIEKAKLNTFYFTNILHVIFIITSFILFMLNNLNLIYMFILMMLMGLLIIYYGFYLSFIIPRKLRNIYNLGYIIEGTVTIQRDGNFDLVIEICKLIFDPKKLETEIKKEINDTIKDLMNDDDRQYYDIDIKYE